MFLPNGHIAQAFIEFDSDEAVAARYLLSAKVTLWPDLFKCAGFIEAAHA